MKLKDLKPVLLSACLVVTSIGSPGKVFAETKIAGNAVVEAFDFSLYELEPDLSEYTKLDLLNGFYVKDTNLPIVTTRYLLGNTLSWSDFKNSIIAFSSLLPEDLFLSGQDSSLTFLFDVRTDFDVLSTPLSGTMYRGIGAFWSIPGTWTSSDYIFIDSHHFQVYLYGSTSSVNNAVNFVLSRSGVPSSGSMSCSVYYKVKDGQVSSGGSSGSMEGGGSSGGGDSGSGGGSGGSSST